METEPKMDIINEADQDEKNKNLCIDRLRSLIERIERLEEEKKSLTADIRDVYSEAKSAGYDAKIMKMIVKLRKIPSADRDEQDYLLDVYRRELGI